MNMSFTRRRLLIASGALATAKLAGAQPAPQRTKGPLVLLDLDQADVDDAYDVVKASPNLPIVVRRWATNSDAARAHVGEPRRVTYGPAPIETLDIYATSRPNAPVHILIHGGAFNMGSARAYAFPAEMFVRAGAHFLVPDFSRAVNHGGSPLPLLDQVQRWPGCAVTPQASGATPIASISAATLPGRNWRRSCSLPTGAADLTYRPTRSRVASAAAERTTGSCSGCRRVALA